VRGEEGVSVRGKGKEKGEDAPSASSSLRASFALASSSALPRSTRGRGWRKEEEGRERSESQ
jgi:hypothetical protein